MHATQEKILIASERAASLYGKTVQGGYVARATREQLHALAENKVYQNPTELWITDNPHAMALLRHAGVEECFACGAGSDFEKFRFFCTVMGDSVANPIKLACHVALRELFRCDLMLGESSCEGIWQTVCEILSREDLTPREYVKKCGVDTVLVPLTPFAALEDFARISGLRVLPVFAPDTYFLPDGKSFAAAVRALGDGIGDWKSFCAALAASLDRFAASGCRVATHSVLPTEFCRPNEYHAALYFEKALGGEVLEGKELALYQAQLWRVLCEAYTARDMTLELLVGETPEKAEKAHTVKGVFSAKAARELLDYLKDRVGLPRLAAYIEQAQLIPTVAALAARYPALAEGVPQIALGIWQGAPADTRAQLRALASVTSLSACTGALPDARLPHFPWAPTLFHRALCSELADWESCGETCAGEENLRRVITRLTGENMQKYYKG